MKKTSIYPYLFLILVLLCTCRKEEEGPVGGNKIEIGQSSVDTVSFYFLDIQSDVISTGNQQVIQHGHVWYTEPEPTIDHERTDLGELGNKATDFQSEIGDLLQNTTYYIRPYIQTEYNTVYGKEETISTLETGKPVLYTQLTTEITLISALSGGEVVFDSGLIITSRGICWDTTEVFTVNECLGKVEDSNPGLGLFTAEMTNLTQGTNYFVRSYAGNDKGISYGEIQSFITIPIVLADVHTGNSQNISPYTAQVTGQVLDAGLGTIFQRGVCWGDFEDPSLENNSGFTINGEGVGNYTADLDSLTHNTSYFFKAYAINEAGVAYGSQKSFTTVEIIAPSVSTTTVDNVTISSAEVIGEVLNLGNGTVSTRGVCWAKDVVFDLNSCVGFTSNGEGTGTFTAQIESLDHGTQYYVKAYTSNEVATGYGELKDFETIEIITPSVTTYQPTTYTAYTVSVNGEVTDEGNGTIFQRGICWSQEPDPTVSNCEGFTNDGEGLGLFISSINGLQHNTEYFLSAYAINQVDTGYGISESFTTLEVILPTVSSYSIINVNSHSADGGGKVLSEGNGTVTTRGLVWNTTGSPSLENYEGITSDGEGMGEFESEMTDLLQNQDYYVHAYATNELGTTYGSNEEQFTTKESCGTISYGGKEYHTLIIGDQCWMNENLDVGTMILGTEDQSDNSSIEKYCYSDNETNCEEFGGLYQWDELMEYETIAGEQGICPEDWHIPTTDDWQEMVDFLGSNINGGGKLKEKGLAHWSEPNTGANNYSGFTALPGGNRYFSSGSFLGGNNYTYFWTSSEGETGESWVIFLGYDNAALGEIEGKKLSGFSVRCLKD